jgi:hypothetical protein
VKSALDHVLRHNTWANGTLLEFCRGLDLSAWAYGRASEISQHDGD